MRKDLRKYFDSIPESRREHIGTLHRLILESFPNAVVNMRYRTPTYSHGEGWVAIANQKNYVSLYTCSAVHLARFRKKHPGYKTGTGCINFLPGDKIPEAAIREVIRHAISHPKG